MAVLVAGLVVVVVVVIGGAVVPAAWGLCWPIVGRGWPM